MGMSLPIRILILVVLCLVIILAIFGSNFSIYGGGYGDRVDDTENIGCNTQTDSENVPDYITARCEDSSSETDGGQTIDDSSEEKVVTSAAERLEEQRVVTGAVEELNQ